MKPCLKFLLAAALFAAAAAKKSYDGYKLVTVVPKDMAQVKLLKEIWTHQTSLSLDFWSNTARPGRKVDISVPPESVDKLQSLLSKWRLKATVEIENIESVIASEQRVRKRRAYSSHAPVPFTLGTGGYDLQKYQSYERVVKYLEDVAEAYPNITELITLTDDRGRTAYTHENRTLYVLKIGSSNSSNKSAYWIDSGIHAREWAASAVTPIFIHDLVTKYTTDSTIKEYVDCIDFYIMPFVNPDGYEYSRNEDRLWRKNRRQAGDDGCYGVDLNRNWDSEFGGEGSSGWPCSDMYHGQTAFSEPETLAIKVFLESIKDNLKAFVSLHTYSQLWLYPYASRENFEPENYKEVRALAQNATKKLQSIYGTNYTVGTPANILYIACGGSMDWAKQTMNTRYAFSLELPPKGRNERIGFMLPEKYIKPTATETWEALKVVAEELINPGSMTQGGGGNDTNEPWL